MRIRLVAVGRGMPPAIQQLVREYSDRLHHYGGVELIEVPHAPWRTDTPERIQQALCWEKERLSPHLTPDHPILTLDSCGEAWTSEQFAHHLDRYRHHGHQRLAFLIGGPNGYHPSLQPPGIKPLSLGPMTFPHLLVRVLLLEQIYRAFTLIHRVPYHR
ncbi:MAG: 23S rRNA (pseudouridine(1915)-N(3))-methyltransferase RlmH [Magnetococcales bacterium]|nr:23S rRNA (pseudouridine(1915)-N(3))-methyltransferase RlmH [Magnetococcales bacterium]